MTAINRTRVDEYDAVDSLHTIKVKENNILTISSNSATQPNANGNDFIIAQGALASNRVGRLVAFGVQASTVANFVVVVNSSTILPVGVAANTPQFVSAQGGHYLGTIAASSTISLVAKTAGSPSQYYQGFIVVEREPSSAAISSE